MMTVEKIWILDETRLSSQFLEAYNQGKAAIHDGVAYWAKGSGRKGVIQHLPFKEVPFQGISEAIKAAQMTTIIVGAASTMIILGAIAIQTRYLAGKMDKIQATVDLISQDIHAHNILFYMDKFTDYFGSLEVARTLLKDRELISEIKDVAVPLLSNLAGKRNQMLSFTDNILALGKTADVSARHFGLIMNFSQMILDVIPMGIHVEYLLYARIGKIGLAEQTLLDGKERYDLALNCYRSHLNDIHRDLIRGEIGEKANAYHSIESSAANLFKSQENEVALALPTGRAAMLEMTA
jgi:hypothetical protein